MAKYTLIRTDENATDFLVASWDDEGIGRDETQPMSGPIFPCRGAPGCYCILVNGKEIVIWCPAGGKQQKQS